MSWVTPEKFAAQVILNVCELSDYTSPGDQPDLLQCTARELESCVIRAFEHFDTTSRPVMNPPADKAEARNRVHAAPRQADSAAAGRAMAGPLTESEARPVMPTARCSNMAHKRYAMTGCTECSTNDRASKP